MTRGAVLAQLHGDAAHRRHHVLVRQHHAFGHARRARRIADCAQVLGFWWLGK